MQKLLYIIGLFLLFVPNIGAQDYQKIGEAISTLTILEERNAWVEEDDGYKHLYIEHNYALEPIKVEQGYVHLMTKKDLFTIGINPAICLADVQKKKRTKWEIVLEERIAGIFGTILVNKDYKVIQKNIATQ